MRTHAIPASHERRFPATPTMQARRCKYRDSWTAPRKPPTAIAISRRTQAGGRSQMRLPLVPILRIIDFGEVHLRRLLRGWCRGCCRGLGRIVDALSGFDTFEECRHDGKII